MKQMILCDTCKPWWIDRCRNNPYPEEKIKVVSGIAKNNYICDTCGTMLEKGTPCAAVSISVDRGGVPYYEWEHDYIVTASQPVDQEQ